MAPPTAPDTSALRMLVLGADVDAFAQALERALGDILQAAPSRPLHWLHAAQPDVWSQACVRWLMAWEDNPEESPEQALIALAQHNHLRQTLHAQGLSYQVLRGPRQERVAQALQSLAPWLPELAPLLPRTGVTSRRPGAMSCEKCGDPDCEHRSFTQLLASRGSP